MATLGNLKIVEQNRPTAEELAAGGAGPVIAEAAFYVHSVLGPGLDENLYRLCFAEELRHRGIDFEQDAEFPVIFRGKVIEQAFRADFMVSGAIVFIIAEDKMDLHNLQIRSLLKLSGREEAFIVNFRVADMRKGIMRASLRREGSND